MGNRGGQIARQKQMPEQVVNKPHQAEAVVAGSWIGSEPGWKIRVTERSLYPWPVDSGALRFD